MGLDLRSARQLGLTSNGRASHNGTSSPPGPSTTNLHMTPGALSPKARLRKLRVDFI